MLSVGWAIAVRWLYKTCCPTGLAADWLIFVIVVVATPVLIGFLDAEIVALYLLIASRFGINSNEVFAGQSLEDHKGFLRLHIDARGHADGLPDQAAAGLPAVAAGPGGCRRPTRGCVPEDPLEPELIETEPIRIRRP